MKMPQRKLKQLIYYLISELGGELRHRIKLVKLLYLIDIEKANKIKSSKPSDKFCGPITGLTYTYHYLGPYSPKIFEATKEMDGKEINEIRGGGSVFFILPNTSRKEIQILDEIESDMPIIQTVLKKKNYGNLESSELKRISYETSQMKNASPFKPIDLYS